MERFCPNCGTEVDERAAFCPACGQSLAEVDDLQPTAPEPPARASTPAARRASTAPPPDAEAPPTAPRDPVAPPPPPPPRQPIELPVTWPLTVSGWLIGAGAIVGVLAMFLPWAPGQDGVFGGFDSVVNVLFVVVLLGVAASVFFSTIVPQFGHRRLVTLAVALAGLGIGLGRLGPAPAGVGAILFFLAMLAATAGALLVELGKDRPMGGPTR